MQPRHSTILVTGATGGIGSELCRLLAAEGATLVMSCIDAAALDKLRAELGPAHRTCAADIARPEGREAVLSACREAGGIDAVINLAGILDFNLFAAQRPDTIERILQVNAVAPILLTRLLLPLLHDRAEGRIINVGSTFGSIGHPGFVAYCASKAAIRSFSEALARELADTRVSVAYIAPRATSTPLNTGRVVALNAALGNKCDPPQEVAGAIVQLLRDSKRLRYLGWPEKLFVRVNALLPSVVHAALVKKLPIIKRFAQENVQ
ncbi:MAG: SDR family oxidoreductase [Gammaproteobacteria bacterium]